MDPLSPSNINPSWGSSPPRSTPSTSASVSTPSRRKHASSSSTSHLIPPSQPASSPFREPKVFGAPTPGLVSPSLDGQGLGGGSSQSPMKGRQDGGGYLRVRLGALERNRKDLLIRFDANVGPILHRIVSFSLDTLQTEVLTCRRPICRITERERTGTCRGPMSNSSDSQNSYK